MARRSQSRAERAEALAARLPSVSPVVVRRMQAHLLDQDFKHRGAPAAMQAFYAWLKDAGIAPEQAPAAAFEHVATSRSRLRALLWGLHMFTPEVSCRAAEPIRRHWDAWLNGRYNRKPRKPKLVRLVGHAPGDWPSEWQAIAARLPRPVRVRGRRYRGLADAMQLNVLSAVGLLLTARDWARTRGVDLALAPSPELIDAYVRWLLTECGVKPRTAADYLERVRIFIGRGDLLTAETAEEIREQIGVLRELADEAEPGKWARLRDFRARFSLPHMLHMAETHRRSAEIAWRHPSAAARLRRKAVVLAMLVNTSDRNGDLRTARIGIEIVRGADGVWRHDIRQGKSRRPKPLEALWPITCRILDAHVLGDRPDWAIEDRIRELGGMNLLSLDRKTVSSTHVAQLIKETYGISPHLVRTLVCDAIRVVRPDAMWAAQAMLGHGDRWMQETYRSDFAEAVAVSKMTECLSEVAEGVGAGSQQSRGRRSRDRIPPAGRSRASGRGGSPTAIIPKCRSDGATVPTMRGRRNASAS